MEKQLLAICGMVLGLFGSAVTIGFFFAHHNFDLQETISLVCFMLIGLLSTLWSER